VTFAVEVVTRLEDFVPELILIQQVAQITKVKIPDVATVWEECGIECRSDDGSP